MTTMDIQARVTANLNLRAAGTKEGEILALVMFGAIVHLTGPVNSAGYAPAYVNGWRDGTTQDVRCESLAPQPSRRVALLAKGAAFRGAAGFDEFGRQPGRISGYVFKPLTTALETT